MYGKVLISCELVVRTGLHIGASNGFSAIGAVDSPVIRDPLSGYPIIPGSSLKGKLRTLLAREITEGRHNQEYKLDRYGKVELDKNRKPKYKYNNCYDCDPDLIKRLFGSSVPIQQSRLQFADCPILDGKNLKPSETMEVKTENGITRDWRYSSKNGEANPRQIERVIPGISFAVRIVYDARNGIEAKETAEDLAYLATAMRLLQRDYLGGHGSRGSGRVSFLNFKLSPFPEGADIEELEKLLVPVEREEPFYNGDAAEDGYGGGDYGDNGDNGDDRNGGNSGEGGTA